MDFTTIVSQSESITNLVTSRIVIPIIIIFLGVAIGKIIKNLILAAGKAIEFDKHAKTFLGQRLPASEITAGFVAGIIYAVAIIYALSIAGVLKLVFEIVLGFLVIFLLLGLLLWIFSIGPNFFSGFWVRKRYNVDDQIKIRGLTGQIQVLGWFKVVFTKNNEMYAVSNRTLRKDLQKLQRS